MTLPVLLLIHFLIQFAIAVDGSLGQQGLSGIPGYDGMVYRAVDYVPVCGVLGSKGHTWEATDYGARTQVCKRNERMY